VDGCAGAALSLCRDLPQFLESISRANVQPLHCNFCQCKEFLSSFTLRLTLGETASTPKVGRYEEEQENLALTEISSAAQGEQHGCNGN